MAQCFILAGYECAIADIDKETAHAAKVRLVHEARAYELDGLFELGSADLIEHRLVPADSIEDAVADAVRRSEEVEVLLDLALAAPVGGLVDRQDHLVVVPHNGRHERRVLRRTCRRSSG